MWIPKANKELHTLPGSVQKNIPIRAFHPNGIFEHNQEYSVSFRFSDIEYSAASEAAQMDMIVQYRDIIKMIDEDCLAQITLVNRKADAAMFREALSIPDQGDGLDVYRHEINKMNMERADAGSNNILRDRYLTISVPRRTVDEAKIVFNRLEGSFKTYFKALGSDCERLTTLERARVLHDFYRPGQSPNFNLDLDREIRLGNDVRDYLCPMGLEFPFDKDYFKVENRYGRVLYLAEFPSNLQDSILSVLMEQPFEMALSMHMINKSREGARRLVEQKLLAVNTEISNSVRVGGKLGNFYAQPPMHLEQKKNGYELVLQNMDERDERIVLGQITLVHMADTLEELNSDTATLLAAGRRKDCQIGSLFYQQRKGLNTVLPYGLRFTETLRTLESECAAMFMPFNTQEIWDREGICYGTNQLSGNLVVADRSKTVNGHAFILAITGGGKSVIAKSEMIAVILKYLNDDVIVIDPQREYSALVELLGGSIINVSANSKDYINVMERNDDLDAGDSIKVKSQSVLSLAEQFLGTINNAQRSIIDRCVRNLMMQRQDECTLVDLYELLLAQKEPEARDIALNFEIFVTGSLNVFAHKSNVDMNKRLLCFDIKDLEDQMKPVGMTVVMDAVLSRVARNKKLGKRTWVYFDELWMMFLMDYTAELVDSFWKLVRKYGGFMTGITQNVTEVMKSNYACNMLANSEFVFMLNQSQPDRETLIRLLDLSPSQAAFITNSPQGFGLMRAGSAVVPLNALFDKNTRLYRAITTKLEEVAQFEAERQRLAGNSKA